MMTSQETGLARWKALSASEKEGYKANFSLTEHFKGNSFVIDGKNSEEA